MAWICPPCNGRRTARCTRPSARAGASGCPTRKSARRPTAAWASRPNFTMPWSATKYRCITSRNSIWPQFDLATGRVAGLEALVRWDNPKFGRVPPSALIPIAEESGLIMPIGARVLHDACRQGKLWRDAGYGPMQVAVNTSAVQFRAGRSGRNRGGHARRDGPAASHLDLEVTEGVIMHDIRETARQLKELKKLGVSVSLDDFGTGYSSLSYLEELPIDNLKIDRKFVQRMNGADNTRTLVQSIVGLAHGLGMRAVAEGVETGEQLEQLKAMGCDRAQSF